MSLSSTYETRSTRWQVIPSAATVPATQKATVSWLPNSVALDADGRIDLTHAFTTHRGSPTTFACCRRLPCLASGGHYDRRLLATWRLPTGTTTSSAATRTSAQTSPVVLSPWNSSRCMTATSLYDMHSSPCTGTPHTCAGNSTMCAGARTLPCDPRTPRLGLLPHRQDADVPAHSSRLPRPPPLILRGRP